MKTNYRDTIFDLRTSVSKNVAILILMGVPPFDPVRPNDDPQGDLHAEYESYLAGLDHSVFELISELRDRNQSKLNDAMKGEDERARLECKLSLALTNNKMRLAHRYLCDINHELAKGPQSILKVDPVATKTPEDPYIEVASLDQWAKGIYKIAIFKKDVDQLVKAGTSVKAEVQEEEDKSGVVKLNNLYITLAFLADYIGSLSPVNKTGDRPNCDAVGEIVETFAKAANKDQVMPAQTKQTVRKLIAEAQKRKLRKLLGADL